MSNEKFKEMNKEELGRKLVEFQDELFKLKVKVQTRQVENTALVNSKKRDIARIKTLLKEMQLKGIQTTAAAESQK